MALLSKDLQSRQKTLKQTEISMRRINDLTLKKSSDCYSVEAGVCFLGKLNL
jgi:hypothetical protein